MRDYSNVPNVFRINSSSSILLDDHQQQQHHKQQQQQHHHLHQQQQQTAPNLNKNVINEPYMNGDINYHNRYHHSATGGSVLLGGEDASGNEDRRNSYSLLDSISHIGNHTNGHLNVNSGGRGKDRLAASNCEPTTPNKSVYGSVQPQPLQPPPLSPVDTIPIASFDKRNSYMLWIVTPVAASFAVAIVIASLAGPQWLLTEEKLPNTNYNGTANFNVLDDGMYITKHTKSSLWILCASQGVDYYCSTIDYFPREEYSPDPNDSTMAIPYAITRSTPFFLVSGIVLLVSYLVLMIAMCSHQHSIYFFTSGILFIISGLLMLIGLIMYISIFKAEIGSKLRPKSPLQPPLFTFQYGESFFLYVVGFISTEIVGVLNVFLFISVQQAGREKTLPCFLYARTPEKVQDMDSKLKAYHMGEVGSADFNCQKHAAFPSEYYSPFTQRRYFFEKPQNCNVHTKNLAKSLNELYTEPAPKMSPFDLPQEFPLTRSVSTTTEIFSNGNRTLSQSSQQLNNVDRKRDSAATFKGSGLSLNMCGISTKGILSSSNANTSYSNNNNNNNNNQSQNRQQKRIKSKDQLFTEFCERAGQRPKPKDIYFIEGDQQEDDQDVYVVDRYENLRKSRRNSCALSNIQNSNLCNSNTSLNKSYPKSLFDLDSCDRAFLNNRINNPYFEQNNSRDRSLYNSRTLPRDFLKRNVEFLNDHPLAERRISASGVYGNKKYYDNGMDDYYRKSNDALESGYRLQQREPYAAGDDSIHWPNAIPTSPSSFSTRSQFRIRSGNLYPAKQQQHKQQQHRQQQQQQSHFYGNHKQAAMASPEGSCEDFGTFDLDRIENERRKSHASLFEVCLDYDNGTAV